MTLPNKDPRDEDPKRTLRGGCSWLSHGSGKCALRRFAVLSLRESLGGFRASLLSKQPRNPSTKGLNDEHT